MRNTLKVALLLTTLVAVMLLIPSICNAADVGTGEELVNAVNNATDGDVINLTTDVTLTTAIEVTNKKITINGNGHSIIGSDELVGVSSPSNRTLVTAMEGSKITLENVTLKNSPKYGAQAYNGGYLVLNGVTVSDCKYGGILNNCGTVEVVDLTLGFNGTTTNNGIEMAKGQVIPVEAEPTLIMNGTLTSSQTEKVINIAEDDADRITSFKVQNIYDTTSDKIYVDGNKIVVTDKDNYLKFESNVSDRVTSENTEGDMYIPNPIVTVNVPNMDSISFEIKLGSTLSEEELSSKIDLSNTNLKIDGFFTDEKYENKFDFRGEIQGDVTIYVKLSKSDVDEKPGTPVDEEKPSVEEEKDDTPKTGVSNYMGLAATLVIISLATIVVIKKRNA